MVAQIRIKDGGGVTRTITRIRMRDESGTLRTIQRIRARDGSGVLRTVFETMTVSVSPATLSQSGSTSTITTATTTVTVTGGIAPFTYEWTERYGNPDGIGVTAGTSGTTAFRKTSTYSGSDYYGTFYATVTDAVGTVRTTGDVAVTITRT